MSNNLKVSCLLVGAGDIATEYAKVLKNLKVPFQVVGRGEASAAKFYQETGVRPVIGGLTQYFQAGESLPMNAIVAVDIPELASVTTLLTGKGVNRILVEKPLTFDENVLSDLITLKKSHQTDIYVAYNRRFYSSVLECKKRLTEDGGVTSFNFEFTEWTHQLSKLNLESEVKKNWLLANSTHVIDLAFFLGGEPSEVITFAEKGKVWPGNTRFVGAGKSNTGALFAYTADWESSGRWRVELLTKKNRYTLCPLEELRVQAIGSLKAEVVKIDNRSDLQFKPGFYGQVSAFLNSENHKSLLTLEEHAKRYPLYRKITYGA